MTNDVPPLPGKDTFTRERMQKIAHLVDEEIPDKWFFVVIAGPMEGQEGRVNYVANGKRENIVTMLKNLLARWEEPGKFQGHFEEEV